MYCSTEIRHFLHHVRLRVSTVIAAVAVLIVCAAGPHQQSAGAENWLQLGWQDYQAGQLAQAQGAFARAAKATPESATPAVWLGAIYAARGDAGGAEHWFRASLLRHPTSAQAAYARDWLHRLTPLAKHGIRAKARPGRWDVTTPEELAQFILASNPYIAPQMALWEGLAIHKAAAGAGVDQRLVTAIVYVESGFDQGAVSPVGARGLGQLMPRTARELGVNPRDPWQNLVGSARLLHANLEEFGSLPLGVAAYNAGGGAVRRYGGIPPYRETQSYVVKVMSVLGRL